MTNPTLYPAQAAGVRRYLDLPQPRRFIFSWKTGCGKTAASLQILCQQMKPGELPPRTLIVCPAVVRNHWYKELAKWAGDSAQEYAGEITVGRSRKLSKKRAKLREQAYSSPIQIVSYDLLSQVTAEGWHYIILDELHHCAQPGSKQSKIVRTLMAANPSADVLGLSATLIPTEAKQLWNPLRLLFGESEWGKPSKTGDVSWNFCFRYCNIEHTEYGVRAYGTNAQYVTELRTRIKNVTYPLSREDIIADLPPLDVKVQQFPSVRSQAKLIEQVKEWHDQFDRDDVNHKVILVRHRQLARAIADALGITGNPEVGTYIDGAMSPEKRAQCLDECERQERCTLVGTHEALSEGIRLMWAQQVLVAEWSQSPGRVMQLLGRFNSVGSQARPQVTIHSTDKTWAAARTLIRRTEDVIAALGASPKEEEIRDIFGEAAEVGTVSADDWVSMFDSHTPDDWRDDEINVG